MAVFKYIAILFCIDQKLKMATMAKKKIEKLDRINGHDFFSEAAVDNL
jgi:hypothetical protein